jgi:membrane protein YqaA with SNARE-associated domain
MSTKALVATVIGGIVNFILGYVIYDLLLGSFYGSHTGGSSVMRETPEMWAIALGCLAYAATLTLVFVRWAGIKTIQTGAQAGAWIGLLTGIAYSAWRYAETYSYDGPMMIAVEGVTMAILSAMTGAAIGWWLGSAD